MTIDLNVDCSIEFIPNTIDPVGVLSIQQPSDMCMNPPSTNVVMGYGKASIRERFK